MENFSTPEKSKKHWDYSLSGQALKNLKRFPKHEQKRIFRVLENMKSDLFGGDTKPIQGEINLYRRRVGDYRIYFRPILEQKIFCIPSIIRRQSH
ncbi:MAG: hypothetical protein AAB556_00810 [Patescibacteria group bacterium]